MDKLVELVVMCVGGRAGLIGFCVAGGLELRRSGGERA